MITTPAKIGALAALVYLVLHLGAYYSGQQPPIDPALLDPGERPMYTEPGLADLLFILVNTPSILVLGSYSHNAIAAVDKIELFLMAAVGISCYGLVGFIVAAVVCKFIAWFAKDV